MNFKELRLCKNLSREDIGRKCRLKSSAIAKWEQGKSKPKLVDIPHLASALGVTIDEVVACFTENDARRTS